MDAVTVRLAGSFGVTVAGLSKLGAGLGSPKAKRLLMLLAVHRGRDVGVDRIVDALWDDMPRQPERNVATLVSRLRADLGSEVIIGGPTFYRLGVPPAVLVDVDVAANLLTEASSRLAVGEPAIAAGAASRALEVLSSGPLLVGESDADWVRAARAGAERLLREARLTAAAAFLLMDDPAAAARVLEDAVAADPLDEAAYRLLMTSYSTVGEPSKALAVYENLRQALASDLGVDPAPETRAVHLAVLRERSPMTDLPDRAVSLPPAPARDPLPGRGIEVARLSTAWSAAAAGEPTLLMIVGEAGIGKTRLAREATGVAESTGGLVLQARCYAAERSLFLQPFVDALAGLVATMRPDRLRELTGARAAVFAGLLPAAGQVFGPRQAERAAPEVELRRAYQGVTDMLSGLATERTLLLVLDDLHNAGRATVDLLHYLARHLGRARLLVIATIRAEQGAAIVDELNDVAGQIELGPLPPDAVANLAVAAGHGDLAEVIFRRTRGHALFVAETLRGLSVGEPGIPESLRAAVLARLRIAGPVTEELLRAGAILGNSVDPAVLAGMLELPAHVVAHRCEQAAASRLLVVADRTYEFANDLVQEILYDTTPTPTRLAYHRRAADLLTNHPESVAAHAVAVDDWPRAAQAYLLAGQRAAARYASSDAEALFGRALRAAERAGQLDLVGRAYVARARVRGRVASYRLAWADAKAGVVAARQSGDRRLEMRALQELGFDTAVALRVPIDEVAVTLREALGIAASLGDRAAEAVLLARLTINTTNRLRFDEALVLGRRAEVAGRAAGHDRALVFGLNGLKAAPAYLGEPAQLAEVLAELVPLQRRLGDLFGLEWSVFESAFRPIGDGDWGLAGDRIVEAIEISRRSGYVAGQALHLAFLGWVNRLQGKTDQALRHGRDAVTIGQQTGHGWGHPVSVGMLSTTLIDSGHREEAAQLLTDARSAIRPGQPEGVLLHYLAPLAEATGSRSVLQEADHLLSGITAPVGSAWLLGTDCYLAVARAWLGADDPARARDVLRPLMSAAERLSWVPALAGGSLVDGRAAAARGDHTAARILISRAVTLATRHHMPIVERDALAHLAALPAD